MLTVHTLIDTLTADVNKNEYRASVAINWRLFAPGETYTGRTKMNSNVLNQETVSATTLKEAVDWLLPKAVKSRMGTAKTASPMPSPRIVSELAEIGVSVVGGVLQGTPKQVEPVSADPLDELAQIEQEWANVQARHRLAQERAKEAKAAKAASLAAMIANMQDELAKLAPPEPTTTTEPTTEPVADETETVAAITGGNILSRRQRS